MTEKNVKCADCRFCDREKNWCVIKALTVRTDSVRTCKVFSSNGSRPA